MNRIMEIFQAPNLDTNLMLAIRKRYLYMMLSLISGILAALLMKSFFVFVMFFILCIVILATTLHLLYMCRTDKLKILEAECIEYIKRNIKEQEYRSYYLFQKGELYYKIYSARKKYKIGNVVKFYLTDNDLVYECDDTFNVLSVFLEVKESNNNKHH